MIGDLIMRISSLCSHDTVCVGMSVWVRCAAIGCIVGADISLLSRIAFEEISQMGGGAL